MQDLETNHHNLALRSDDSIPPKQATNIHFPISCLSSSLDKHISFHVPVESNHNVQIFVFCFSSEVVLSMLYIYPRSLWFSAVLLNWNMWCRKMVRCEVVRNIRGSFTKDYEYHFKTVGCKHGEMSKNGDSQAVGGEQEAMPIFHANFCGHIMKRGIGRSGQKGNVREEVHSFRGMILPLCTTVF